MSEEAKSLLEKMRGPGSPWILFFPDRGEGFCYYPVGCAIEACTVEGREFWEIEPYLKKIKEDVGVTYVLA